MFQPTTPRILCHQPCYPKLMGVEGLNTKRVPFAPRIWFAAKLVCSSFLSHSLQGGTSRKDRNELEPPVRLFQIRGIETFNRKAVEVLASAASLNSNDVFLLKTQGDHYLWYGKVRPRALEVEGGGENFFISIPLISTSLRQWPLLYYFYITRKGVHSYVHS